MVTRMTSFLANLEVRYMPSLPDPNLLAPPWIQTITGRSRAFSGAMTFKYKQSSEKLFP